MSRETWTYQKNIHNENDLLQNTDFVSKSSCCLLDFNKQFFFLCCNIFSGWTEVNLTVEGTQGHSSVPPKETAIGILAHAIANLEDKKQPSRFGDSVEYDTMSYVAPFASFGYKLILANLWLFRSIVSKVRIYI